MIEGAHEGHGLGHEFLRHVERTRLLVHLVDARPMDGSDPVANYRGIRRELELYSPALAARPELIVVTKLDLTGSDEARERIATELCREVIPISAVTGQGIPALVHRVGELLDKLPAPVEPPPMVRPAPRTVEPGPMPDPATVPAPATSDA